MGQEQLLKLLTHLQTTPELLGLGQVDPLVLVLPSGLKTVEENWFNGSAI